MMAEIGTITHTLFKGTIASVILAVPAWVENLESGLKIVSSGLACIIAIFTIIAAVLKYRKGREVRKFKKRT